ncbi:MAG TPA: ABC transporter permease [Candidatus Limnocylindrales bacterium]|jgi:ABC-2 type transport system permease protein|nr:ABC transporter permease [Candidatus Limnocylindrales bacterium]
MALVKLVIRIFALIGKEITEVFRRPGAVLSLVLGPFLILAVFGLGYQGFKKDLTAIVILQPSSPFPQDIESYKDLGVRGISVVQVTPDRASAEAQLRADQVDVVIIPPADPISDIKAGRQAEVTIVTNVADPVAANYTGFIGETLSSTINREIYRLGAKEGEDYAITIGGQDLSNVPPEVIASPTKATLVNLAPSPPTIVGFYGPAALALVLQHMAVTLIALSIVRERSGGSLDRFRASPMRANEVVIGKVLAFGILGGGIAALSVWLLVSFLGVPVLGPPGLLALVIGMLLVASLGLGLLISVISDSERQAVQLSLLTLLASMFFSGFVLRIEEFQPLVQAGAYLLPVTHGITLMQELMLGGSIVHGWQLLALGVIAAVLLAFSWALLYREMRPE